MVLVVVVLGSLALGLLAGRWWAPILPVAAVGIFYGGVLAGWWGNGVGDGWQFALSLVLGLAGLAAVAGIAARALIGSRGRGHAH